MRLEGSQVYPTPLLPMYKVELSCDSAPNTGRDTASSGMLSMIMTEVFLVRSPH